MNSRARTFRLSTSKTGALQGRVAHGTLPFTRSGRIAPAAFVAILDDDDMWEPDYLERCEIEAQAHDLDMVAAGIVYNHSGEQDSVLLRSPDSLNVNDLLVRNTYIQGSNLFRKIVQNT